MEEGEGDDALGNELLAINAIFPGVISLLPGSSNSYVLSVHPGFESTAQQRRLGIEIHLTFPEAYPFASPIVKTCTGIERQRVENIVSYANGSEVLFTLIEALQSQSTSPSIGDTDNAHATSTDKVKLERDGTDCIKEEVVWTIGEPVIDRKSIFIGRATTVRNEGDVDRVLRAIREDKKMAKAAHNIWAYRYSDTPLTNIPLIPTSRTLPVRGPKQRHEDQDVATRERLVCAHDDDGESGAGPRLAFLLDMTHSRNVFVVVTRFFGGVLLGEVRFKHIGSAARDALLRGAFIKGCA